MTRFADRVVLITGSSSGIGAETAVDFAREGAKVVITGRQGDKLQTTLGRCVAAGAREENNLTTLAAQVFSIEGDVTVGEDVQGIVESTVSRFGTIHILVNNAGIPAPGRTADADLSVVDQCYMTNFRSVLMVTQQALPHIVQNKEKGCVINVGSVAGYLPAFNCVAYSTMKAAVHHFTRCLSMEVADHGVRVNAVAPGTIDNEFLVRPGGSLENQPEELEPFWRHVAPMYPLGRVGHVDEVSRGIRFLASDEASFTTGTILPIDGGRACSSLGRPHSVKK